LVELHFIYVAAYLHQYSFLRDLKVTEYNGHQCKLKSLLIPIPNIAKVVM